MEHTILDMYSTLSNTKHCYNVFPLHEFTQEIFEPYPFFYILNYFRACFSTNWISKCNKYIFSYRFPAINKSSKIWVYIALMLCSSLLSITLLYTNSNPNEDFRYLIIHLELVNVSFQGCSWICLRYFESRLVVFDRGKWWMLNG